VSPWARAEKWAERGRELSERGSQREALRERLSERGCLYSVLHGFISGEARAANVRVAARWPAATPHRNSFW